MTLNRRLDGDRLACWATPIVTRSWPESAHLDEALREAVMARRRSHPGISTSVVGGWQSEPDLLHWPVPEISTLRHRITEVAGFLQGVVTAALPSAPAVDLVAEAWAVVHEQGHSHDLHSHPGSVWSGAYYVAVPEGPDAGGALELLDPRHGARALEPAESAWFRFEPRPGHMIAFPSWVLHRVAPLRRPGPRVSIAFNVGVLRGGAWS